MFSSKKRIGERLKIGMIFPGQGSQFVGMCKEFYDTERIVQEIFDDASGALKTNFIKLCFASSDKALKETIVTQTAIFIVSAGIYSLLREKYGIVPDLVAGHSLGEYSAVYAAGGMNFFDTLYLLNKRGEFMKAAIENQNGSMLAVMNLSHEKLLEICSQYDDPSSNDQVAELAVFNSPSQTVVSGTLPELESIKKDVEMMRGKAIFIPVPGAFHSRLMRQAEMNFAHYLLKVDFAPLEIPLVNNIMAQEVRSSESVKLSIVKQTSSHIYWWNSMEHFKNLDLIIEVGPNDKFSKMLKREWPDKEIVSVNNQSDIEQLVKLITKLNSEK